MMIAVVKDSWEIHPPFLIYSVTTGTKSGKQNTLNSYPGAIKEPIFRRHSLFRNKKE